MYSHKFRINWTNLIFFSGLPLVAIVGTVLLCFFGIVRWPTWVLAGTYMLLTGLAVTAGYHRLYSHKTYQAAWPLRLMLLLLGAGTFEGSALEWCTDHRNHHRYTDTDKDPYNIKAGFWYAHIGWIFRLNPDARDFSNVEDLNKDPLVYLQDKYYVPIALFMGFILPMAIAMLWGDPWGGLLIGGALRMCVNHHFTFAINSVCHYFGKKTYSDRQSARDNWFTAFLTLGEGFHNFHHQFPLDYRNGIRFFDFDPTKWVIYLLSRVGLAKGLKCVGEHRIIHYRLQMQERQLLDELVQRQGANENQLKQIAEPVRNKIDQVLTTMDSLEREYMQLKQQKLEKAYTRVGEYRAHLHAYRQRFKTARRELKIHLIEWSEMVKNCKQFVGFNTSQV
ncbi:MAG: fatty acid desaturase [Gammaproteobacteria bacterium]